MWPTVLAIVLFAIQGTSVQTKRLCDNPTGRHGMKFARHPFDCSQYINCVQRTPTHPVYRRCDFGQFFDLKRFQCLPSYSVHCPLDQCQIPGVKEYKYMDPNKCSAYYSCYKGRAYANCCPEGQGYHKKKGCIKMPSCKSMCALRDRVPACSKLPIEGSPTNFKRYVKEGMWEIERCPPGRAYNPANCDCSHTGLIKAGRVCKPDVVLNFDDGTVRDSSGNNNIVRASGVRVVNGTAFFNSRSKIVIDKLPPSPADEGVLIVKMSYKELNYRGVMNRMQGLLTNGHCNPRQPASVLIAKQRQYVMLGCEARKGIRQNSRSFPLATIPKEWKEIIYIKDEYQLEGRVCGATYNNWADGPIVDTGCGFQIGKIKGITGYFGYLDNISIYRCKPLDAVINLKY